MNIHFIPSWIYPNTCQLTVILVKLTTIIPPPQGMKTITQTGQRLESAGEALWTPFAPHLKA